MNPTDLFVVQRTTGVDAGTYKVAAQDIPANAVVSATAPPSPWNGLLWLDTTADTLKTWDGSAWVEPPPGGVTQIVAGSNVTISPTDGTGVVTVNATGGGGGGTGTATNTNIFGTARVRGIAANGVGTGLAGCTVSLHPNLAAVSRITFDTPQVDTSYKVVIGANATVVNVGAQLVGKTPTYFDIGSWSTANGQYGSDAIDFAVFDNEPTEVALTTTGDVINYSGASAWGDIADDGVINNGLNVASATVVSTGVYEVFFQTPMPDAQYAVNASVSNDNTRFVRVVSRTASSFVVEFLNGSNNKTKAPFTFTVFSTNALPIPRGGTGADAWVTFVGTQRKSNPSQNPVSGEEVPIEASFNVSSVVYNDTGSYTVNFTTPMPTAKYAVSGTATLSKTGAAVPRFMSPATADNCTTSSVQVYTADDTGTFGNCAKVSVVINATNATLPLSFTSDQIEAAISNPGLSAWGSVNANGTTNSSLNVASVTKAATGRYEIYFQTPMASNDYSVNGSAANAYKGTIFSITGKTTLGFTAQTYNPGGGSPSNIDGDFDFQVAATNVVLPQTVTAEEIAALKVTAPKAFGVVRGVGTVALLNGFNCSVSYIGTGYYRISFTNPLPAADYSVVVTGATTAGNGSKGPYVDVAGTAYFDIYTYNDSGQFADNARISFSVFQNS